jgi:hypothetical protein
MPSPDRRRKGLIAMGVRRCKPLRRRQITRY